VLDVREGREVFVFASGVEVRQVQEGREPDQTACKEWAQEKKYRLSTVSAFLVSTTVGPSPFRRNQLDPAARKLEEEEKQVSQAG